MTHEETISAFLKARAEKAERERDEARAQNLAFEDNAAVDAVRIRTFAAENARLREAMNKYSEDEILKENARLREALEKIAEKICKESVIHRIATEALNPSPAPADQTFNCPPRSSAPCCSKNADGQGHDSWCGERLEEL